MLIAAAHSHAVQRSGLSPCTDHKFGVKQQSRISGRPNGSIRRHRRRYPRQQPRRNSEPPSIRALSRWRFQLDSKSLGRSTCSPKKEPLSITEPVFIAPPAPTTFSMVYIPPTSSRALRVCSMSGPSDGTPRCSDVEYALHGGEAMVKKARVFRFKARISCGLVESPLVKASLPNLSTYLGWS